MRPLNSALDLLTLAFALPSADSAQDTRNVTEPKSPLVCTDLKAQLATTSTGIAEADEHKLDSSRIQKALDKCGKGKAVALRVDGPNNAFLSGPLELREGVTLLVDKGVTLYASRDADVYATEPGKCGIVA